MADRKDYSYHRPDGEPFVNQDASGGDAGNFTYNTAYGSSDNGDFGSWMVIVIMMVAFWPVGLFLLFRKLMGYSDTRTRRRRRTTGRHPYDLRQERNRRTRTDQTAGGQYQQSWSASSQNTGRTRDTSPKKEYATGEKAYTPPEHMQAKSKYFKKTPTGKGLIIGGGITAGIFGLGFFTTLLDSISTGGLTTDFASLFAILAFFGTGMVLLASGIGRGRKGRRFRKYLSVIGNRDLISVRELAQKTGIREKKVRDDLQSMLDMGMFPEGYLDLSVDMLVLSDSVSVPREEPTAEPAAESAKDDQSVLMEIREVNDEIADEDMSRKIDRIGEITAKILDYQRKNPNKDNQMRSFLNYYLPTTLKILRAYAQLEAQGIEGQNISSAKERIEGMMDKVVEGFEKQLDMLFQNDAMDITTDVSVLEQMLKKDGLSGDQGMTLGG